jgi:hypothetical protein
MTMADIGCWASAPPEIPAGARIPTIACGMKSPCHP